MAYSSLHSPTTEVNIHEDMARCRDAVHSGKWAELAGIVHGIAAKTRRVAEVGRAQVDAATEPRQRSSLDGAVKRLERGKITHWLSI